MLWWTTQNLVIATLLAGTVWGACRALRVGPVWRHALWMVVLVKMLTPPLVFWPWAVRDPLHLSDRSASVMRTVEPNALAEAPPAQEQAPVSVPDVAADFPVSADAGSADDATPETSGQHEDPPPAAIDIAPRSSVARLRAAGAANAAVEPIMRHRVQRLLPWLGGIWISGSVAFALIQFARIIRMLKLLRGARLGDTSLMGSVAASARRLGIRAVAVRVVPGIGSPVIWALQMPLLLWPYELPPGMSELAVRGLIVHELAHVKRRDHWVGWLELLAGCVWWWNPLFWYVRHQLRENAELACDAWVVSALARGREGRRAYAEALLAVCESASNRLNHMNRTAPMPAVGVSTGGRRFLERRLAMILRDRVPLRLPRLGFVSVAMMALFTLPAWSQRAPETARQPEAVANPVDTNGALEVRSIRSGVLGISTDGTVLERTISPPEPLPQDAREMLDQLAREQTETRREAERQIEQARANTIRGLKQIQDRYTKAGQLDEAVAVRDAVRRLQAQRVTTLWTGPNPARHRSEARATIRAEADPGNLTVYRDKVGQSFYFDVTGETQGTVWGTEIYTDDSVLAAAAVHAGVLTPGQRGVVKVTILPGRDSYAGSESDGIKSLSYQEWPGSYSVDPSEPRRSAIMKLGSGMSGGPGMGPGRPRHSVGPLPEGGGPGSPGGPVPDGSMPPGGNRSGYPGGPLPGGGVREYHKSEAGDGDRPISAPPATAYPDGSTSAEPGLGSDSTGGTSKGAPGTTPPGGPATPTAASGTAAPAPLDPATAADQLQQLRDHVGQSFVTKLVGSTQGQVWGTDAYTDDSSPAAAAVHAGVLHDGESGRVKITILPGQDSYKGSEHNGVTSESWQEWPGSFRIEPAKDDAADRAAPVRAPGN